ncbi:MAG: hypothetical protein HY885_15550 [Deltaproteobacteria bacterium]|nr:hypothetical protein [Deltaproteobacteria bacterium]
MMPRLGTKYDVAIEVTSKPKAEYLTDEYFALDLPVAPAILVGDEIVTEGKDCEDRAVEVVICRSLGLPEPEEESKTGVLGRLFGR